MSVAYHPLKIETDRLVIRPIDYDDMSTFHAIAEQREVALMLASIPHPLSQDEARNWVAERVYQGKPGFAAGIYRSDGTLLGCIGLVDRPLTVNYFLGPDHWGQGYATEALIAFLDWCAEQFGLREIRTGAMHDNVGSHRVLEKAGFRFTHVARHRPPIRPKSDRLFMFWKGFGAPEPLIIRTARLFIHKIRPAYATRLSQLGDDPLVARMLPFIELPFTPERARAWITSGGDGLENHRLAITTEEGYLIGACGLFLSGKSATITGWIGREYWNNGFASEAAKGLAHGAFAKFPTFDHLECSVMQDNIVAVRILEKLGFELTSEHLVRRPEKGEPTLTQIFRLTRPQFESNQARQHRHKS